MSRARRGVARTFQTPRLFGELTCRRERRGRAAAALAGDTRRRAARADREQLIEPARSWTRSGARWSPTSPTGTSAGSRSPARWPGSPPCCCSTSRPPVSTTARPRRCWNCCARSREKYGCCILVIDHDMKLVHATSSDRVQVLDEGRVIFVGSPGGGLQAGARGRGLPRGGRLMAPPARDRRSGRRLRRHAGSQAGLAHARGGGSPRCPGGERRRQVDAHEDDRRAWSTHGRGRIALRRRGHRRETDGQRRGPHWASRYVLRGGRSSLRSRSRRTC